MGRWARFNMISRRSGFRSEQSVLAYTRDAAYANFAEK